MSRWGSLNWRKWNDFVLEKNGVFEESDYKFVLTAPKRIYGGVRAVFNTKKEAENYMKENIGSKSWKYTTIKKELIK